jgi:hypothetical protein
MPDDREVIAAAQERVDKRKKAERNGLAERNGQAERSAADPSDSQADFEIESLDGLCPKAIRWIVPRRIPLGKVVMFAGDGGHGKSGLTLYLAACTSKGKAAFGQEYSKPLQGDTLIIQCEDDWEDTITPRLLAFGADMKHIHRLKRRDENGKALSFCLAHYQALERLLKKYPAIKLVVIDPAGAYIGSGVDDHKESELRALLGPLAELAARMGVTILLVKHFSKSPTVKAVSKISGSAAYANSVRAAFVVLPDEMDQDRALFLPVKWNIGRVPKGLAFRRTTVTDERVDEILRPFEISEEDRRRIGEAVFNLDWEGEVDTTADSHLADLVRAARGPSKVEACMEWLKEFLAEFAYPDKELQAAAEGKGFTFDNLKDAKARLRNKNHANPPLYSQAKGFRGVWWNGFGSPESWTLRPPPQTPQTGKTPGNNGVHQSGVNLCTPQTGEHSENPGKSSSLGSLGGLENDSDLDIPPDWLGPD